MSDRAELLHIDVKKLGRIPDGGGHRVLGRVTGTPRTRGRGYDHLHVAVDDMSRVAYVAPFDEERGTTCARFLLDAAAFFASHGVRIERVLTDNAKNYTLSKAFAAALDEIGARHKVTRPFRPQINGKDVHLCQAASSARSGLNNVPARSIAQSTRSWVRASAMMA